MPDGEDGLRITEIPLILGPENWSTIDERFHSDPIIDSARSAHAELLRTFESITLTHRDVMRDMMHTSAANLARSHQHATRIKDAVMETAERGLTRLREHIAAIDEATSRVPDPPSPVVAEITSNRLFGLSPADRTARIRKAIELDQRGTLAVALTLGDAWVHGLSEEERAMHQDAYRRKHYAGALERREAAVRALEILTDAARTYAMRVDSLFDRGQILQAENAAAAAALRLAGGGVTSRSR